MAKKKQSESECESVYKVKKGDKLPAIAERLGVPLEDLMKHNGIENPHVLWIGQKIKIPNTEKRTGNKEL